MSIAATREKGEQVSRFQGKTGERGELVFDPEKGSTSFIVSHDGRLRKAASGQDVNGAKLVPISGKNTLIRYGAVLLPSDAGALLDLPSLIAEIEEYLDRYVDLSANFRSVASHYVLLTWVYDAFNELPYLRFRGQPGSGKTRALIVVGSLCYQAFMASGASTVSPIFHTLDTFRGTLILDEADFRFSDEKLELVKILNNGNVRGFPVFRATQNAQKTFDPRAFHVFGPKLIAMRNCFQDPALESRFLTEEMGQRRTPDHIPINLPNVQQDEARALRNKLLGYRLSVIDAMQLNPSLADESLSARLNQILIPLLSVAVDGEARQRMLAVARSMERLFKSHQQERPEALLLGVLLDLLPKAKAALPVLEVTALFGERHGADFQRPITARYVGSLLRQKLHLATYKTQGVYVIPEIEWPKIAVLAQKFGVAETDRHLARNTE